MTEDQHISLGNGFGFTPSFPYGKLSLILVISAIPIGRHIVLHGRCMDELVFDAVDGNFHVHRQLPYETKDFSTSIQAYMLELLMGDSTTILIPMSSLLPISIYSFIGSISAMSNRLKHHILMVAHQHLCIGHLHDLPQNFDSIGIPVDNISEDIQCIIRLEIDLLHDRLKSPQIAVDVG